MTYGNIHVGKNDTRDSFRVPGFITPLDTVGAFLKHETLKTQGGGTLVS